jgi:FKBP-type peptidyl-prolyl cis-trans isomerase (trigger factor)
MIRFSHKNVDIVLTGILLIIFALIGCSDSGSQREDVFILRVGDRVVTVQDFNRALELAMAAYSHKDVQDTDGVKEAQLRLINQMAEELVILERAKELGIEITDSELEKAVSDIKEDYPDDAFQETLLEYAVPYSSWEKGLKNRLLLEKVVAKELGEQILITADDISKYYEEHHKEESLTSSSEETQKDINRSILKHLRRKKLEESYQAWIKNLKQKYKIEINKVEWEKITG